MRLEIERLLLQLHHQFQPLDRLAEEDTRRKKAADAIYHSRGYGY